MYRRQQTRKKDAKFFTSSRYSVTSSCNFTIKPLVVVCCCVAISVSTCQNKFSTLIVVENAMDPQRPRARFIEDRVGMRIDLAHGYTSCFDIAPVINSAWRIARVTMVSV